MADHVHLLAHKKEALQWVTRRCRNLRVIDVRWNGFPVPLLVDLIRVSPLLELFLASYGEKEVFETIYERCPHIKGLGILHSDLPLGALGKFTSLTAIELGSSASFLNADTKALAGILGRNPNLQIVHLLGTANSFALLGSLRPGRLQSFSVPYEQNRITAAQVRLLQPFTRLDNINFGQSSYSDFFQVLHGLARNHPNIQSLSFFPNDFPNEVRVLSRLADGKIFPELKKLGCRIKPATREAYAELARIRKRIVLYDYEQERENPHSWCYPPLGLWGLMKKYGGDSYKQW